MLKCQIAAIGEKNRQVCPHQSVAKIACDFRWRSNSPRSTYKIARCVAGLRSIRRYYEDGNENATKHKALMSKNRMALHVRYKPWYISLRYSAKQEPGNLSNEDGDGNANATKQKI